MLRTADAHTPSLTTGDVLASLIGYVVVYAIIYSFGLFYLYRLLRDGPTGPQGEITGATAMRPMAAAVFGGNRDGQHTAGRGVIRWTRPG